MAEPAVPLQRRRIELPLLEARTRLTQIVRLTPVTGQITVITDRGQPVAAIVPITAVPGRSENSAAGWMRRIEQVREAVRHQHAQRTTALEHALTTVWAVLDRLRPPGTDRSVDQLRVAHRDVLARPAPSTDSP
jgi:antitoxin (DNA-binding transcriptional repressor) of toxin-antitoxin stability system